MENITTELNGIKYLMVEILCASGAHERKLKKMLTKHSGIYQGVKDVKSGGLFSPACVIVKVLIPESNVVDWNNDFEI